MKILKIKTLFLICAIGAFQVSCEKEVDLQDQDGGNNSNNKITGKWNFAGMTANTKTITTAGTGVNEEKIINSYGFISQKNTGTVTIDASKFTSEGLGYSVDTVVNTELYLGGILFDSFETQYKVDMPLSTGSAAYQAIGNDSIYFQNGFITLDPSRGSGLPIATTPSGSKISWLNDTLVLKTLVSNSSVQNINGVNAQVVTNISQTVKLKK